MNRLAFARLARAAAAASVLVGCAGDSSPARPVRPIAIEMRDIAFSPAAVTVSRGDRVRFVFTNRSAVAHDAFIGDEQEQAEHEASGEGGHGDHGDDAVTVQPGKSAELVATFDETGTQLIGCHEPGHYEAGMRVVITVE